MDLGWLDQLPQPNQKRLAVRVSDEARRWLRKGHPWLYEDSITSISHDGQAGDLAVVFDSKRDFVAIGLFDPNSPIRVKVLHRGKPTPINDQWWGTQLEEALVRRQGLLASTHTTGVRCINGENDGFPGLVVDKYDQIAVVKIYTEAWLPYLATLVPQLVELLELESLVLRLSRRSANHVPAVIYDGMAIYGHAPTAPVLFKENGLTLEADVVAGQKTGYFLDQRDNRHLIGENARGARVLDVFCAGGGFTVAAAAGGARSVLSVDISAPALSATARNLAHNGHIPAVANCKASSRQGDAFEVLEQLAKEGKRFDVVVVDPPAFAQNQASVASALRAYARLSQLAIPLVNSGGLLMQASCSSRVTAEDFYRVVTKTASNAGVQLEELCRSGHALDHPVRFEEGKYLKAIFARVRR
ncbi:MAG: class I SAM-dependent methyltransferase [Acidimicrobiia bacterium]